MRQVETTFRALLVVRTDRTMAVRKVAKAPYLSQFVATRAQEIVRGRSTVDEAVRGYDAGGRIAERRMPKGYRLDRRV